MDISNVCEVLRKDGWRFPESSTFEQAVTAAKLWYAKDSLGTTCLGACRIVQTLRYGVLLELSAQAYVRSRRRNGDDTFVREFSRNCGFDEMRTSATHSSITEVCALLTAVEYTPAEMRYVVSCFVHGFDRAVLAYGMDFEARALQALIPLPTVSSSVFVSGKSDMQSDARLARAGRTSDTMWRRTGFGEPVSTTAWLGTPTQPSARSNP